MAAGLRGGHAAHPVSTAARSAIIPLPPSGRSRRISVAAAGSRPTAPGAHH